MLDKFKMFDKLPPELKIETAQNLSNPDLGNLAQTSKLHLALFKPMIDTRKLLHYVVHGEHEAVKALLKKDMRLIFKRYKVTDCSGRTFDNVSSFEYTLWALDKHMWEEMIACIPQNEEGREVFAQLMAQYNKVNTDGVTYRLNENTITEKHFDFENTIIKELKTQLDSIKAVWTRNWDVIDKQWREEVGGTQKLLPVHVVYEYCSNEPFYPVPKFTSQPKSSKQFYNWVTEKDENWFSGVSKLAIDFAIYKEEDLAVRAATADGHRSRASGAVARAFGAMKALFEVRTKDFINLRLQLEEQPSMAFDGL